MTDLNQLDEAHVPLEKADQLGSKEQEHTEISDTDTKATEIEEIASDVGVDGAETEDEKENPAEQMTKDETVSQSDEEEKKYPTMYYRFNPVVKVLEFHKGGIPQNVTKESIVEDEELVDLNSSFEHDLEQLEKAEDKLRLNSPKTLYQLDKEDEEESYQEFQLTWGSQRQRYSHREEEDQKCYEYLESLALPHTDALFTPEMRELFREYRGLEVELMCFKAMKAQRYLRRFVSYGSKDNIRRFLNFLEDYYDHCRIVEKRTGVKTKSKKKIKKLQGYGEATILDNIEFRARVKGIKQELSPEKPFFPHRWKEYFQFFKNPKYFWNKVMRNWFDLYNLCMNTATMQALMGFEPRRTKPMEIIHFMLRRKIPEMLQRPNEKDMSALHRVDAYFSANKKSCATGCKYHRGKLLLLLINLGQYKLVKYCIENGMEVNLKICSTRIKHLCWGVVEKKDINGQNPKLVPGVHLDSFYELTTPLAAAAYYVSNGGNSDMVRLLLGMGANPLLLNDLAIRNCVSTVTAENKQKKDDEPSERLAFKQVSSEIHGRRMIVAKAHEMLVASNNARRAPGSGMTRNSLKSIRGSNRIRKSASQRKNQVMIEDFNLAYYYKVALLYQACVEERWDAVSKLIRSQDDEVILHHEQRNQTSRVSQSPLSKHEKEMMKRGSIERDLHKVHVYDKRYATGTRKIVEYLQNREDVGFKYDQEVTVLVLKTIDRLLADGLKNYKRSKTKGSAKWGVDMASNSKYINGIIILLEKTQLFLNEKRMKRIVELMEKALWDLNGGDTTSTMWMLNNKQIRYYLRLETPESKEDRKLLLKRNVNSLITDKSVRQVLFLDGSDKYRKTRASGKTWKSTMKSTMTNVDAIDQTHQDLFLAAGRSDHVEFINHFMTYGLVPDETTAMQMMKFAVENGSGMLMFKLKSFMEHKHPEFAPELVEFAVNVAIEDLHSESLEILFDLHPKSIAVEQALYFISDTLILCGDAPELVRRRKPVYDILLKRLELSEAQALELIEENLRKFAMLWSVGLLQLLKTVDKKYPNLISKDMFDSFLRFQESSRGPPTEDLRHDLFEVVKYMYHQLADDLQKDYSARTAALLKFLNPRWESFDISEML
mmetsp:Transcript_4628/g.5227  ORF Transcript_4628/g.5227 Transcript_4628/m.5227 type:complete len:1110 (+) Transcript_4628:391-3720(+)